MSKQTTDMTKRELAEALAVRYEEGDPRDDATAWYLANMTKHQLLEQVEYLRGERTQEQLTYRYDH